MSRSFSPAMTAPVGIILLAAGGSTRMGRPKQLLPYRGQSLLRHAATVVAESRCRPAVVVLGAEYQNSLKELSGLPVHATENTLWSHGIGTSIRMGMDALLREDAGLGAVILALCDQPFITPA